MQTPHEDSVLAAEAAALAGSSGSPLLDDAVMRFYETLQFLPADADGRGIDAIVRVPIAFKLRE